MLVATNLYLTQLASNSKAVRPRRAQQRHRIGEQRAHRLREMPIGTISREPAHRSERNAARGPRRMDGYLDQLSLPSLSGGGVRAQRGEFEKAQ